MLKAGMIIHVLMTAAASQAASQTEADPREWFEKWMHVPGWYATLCRENGLSEEQLNLLASDLRMPIWADELGGTIERWKSADVDLIPILVTLTEQREPPLLGSSPEQLEVYVRRVYRWLGLLGDERASDHLLRMTDEALAKGVSSKEEAALLGNLFIALGFSGSDKAVDLLWKAQTDAFWQGEEAPVIDLPAYDTRTAEQATREYMESLRSYAFRALATTRSERVLHALATGEGLNPRFADEFDVEFKYAARRCAGVVGDPERYGIALSQERDEKLRAIYEKHGKEYKPTPVNPNPGPPVSNDPPLGLFYRK